MKQAEKSEEACLEGLKCFKKESVIALSVTLTLSQSIFYQKHLVCTKQTADSDTVSTYRVSSVQLVTNKKLEAFNKA